MVREAVWLLTSALPRLIARLKDATAFGIPRYFAIGALPQWRWSIIREQDTTRTEIGGGSDDGDQPIFCAAGAAGGEPSFAAWYKRRARDGAN